METQGAAVEWAACRRYAGYSVTRCGTMVRNDRTGKMIRIGDHSVGYKVVSLVKLKTSRDVWGNGKKRARTGVHRLVADAFHGICPDGCEVHHIDHDKTNNAASNLMYVTRAENIQYAWAAGRMSNNPMSKTGPENPNWGRVASKETREKQSVAKRGERHFRARKFDVAKIQELYDQNKTDAEIAAIMGCGRTTIGDILRGTHWSVRAEYVARQKPRVNPNAAKSKSGVQGKSALHVDVEPVGVGVPVGNATGQSKVEVA